MDLEEEIEKLKLRLNIVEVQMELMKQPRTAPLPPTRLAAGSTTETVFTPRLFEAPRKVKKDAASSQSSICPS